MRAALLVLLAACSAPREDPPAPAAVPRPPDKITVGVVRSPPGTLVIDPQTGAVVGSAPGSFQLDRSIDPLRLDFVHPDYISEKRIITPSEDVALSVPMRYRPRRVGEEPPPEKR
jgi:hypothetical protein